MQKLKMSFFHLLESLFTCFLKDKTLHNHWDYAGFTVPYYNIPSNNRELQRPFATRTMIPYYNIPSNNRELQLLIKNCFRHFIITYQVITGNYSFLTCWKLILVIITYQVITGNYSTEESRRRSTTNYNIPSNNRELQLIRNLCFPHWDYNIPSNNRELQQLAKKSGIGKYYNIPSNNRELQRRFSSNMTSPYYNIPSNNRELQQLF